MKHPVSQVFSAMLAAILLAGFAGSAKADATADLDTLLAEFWESQMVNFPTFASSLGDRRFNDQWTDQSINAIDDRQAERREFLRRLYAFDSKALSDNNQLNYELFRRDLQSDVDVHQFKGYLIPFSHRGGVQTLNQIASRLRFTTIQDYEDWLVRMSKVDAVVEQTIARAERGRKEGLIAPSILMQRIPAQIATQLVEVGPK